MTTGNNTPHQQGNGNQNNGEFKSILTDWQDVYDVDIQYDDLRKQDWKFAKFFYEKDTLIFTN